MAKIARRVTRYTLGGLLSVQAAALSALARQIQPRAPKVHGVGLVIHPYDGALFDQAASAFAVFQTYAPDQWAKLCASANYVQVRPLAGEMRGRYDHVSRSYHLDVRFVRSSEPARIAQQLVHDAQHAAGPDVSSRKDRAGALAIERACVEAEIVFATRLPAPGHLASAASARLLTVEQDFSRDHEAVPRVPMWLNRLVWWLLE